MYIKDFTNYNSCINDHYVTSVLWFYCNGSITITISVFPDQFIIVKYWLGTKNWSCFMTWQVLNVQLIMLLELMLLDHIISIFSRWVWTWKWDSKKETKRGHTNSSSSQWERVQYNHFGKGQRIHLFMKLGKKVKVCCKYWSFYKSKIQYIDVHLTHDIMKTIISIIA